jgi:hypothetical protein
MLWLVVMLIIAVAWDTNRRIQKVNERVEKVIEHLSGLRQYLYEIDPQFDDERRANVGDYHADQKWRELLAQKKESGRRTLETTFARD